MDVVYMKFETYAKILKILYDEKLIGPYGIYGCLKCGEYIPDISAGCPKCKNTGKENDRENDMVYI